MIEFFKIIIYYPLTNLLVIFYNFSGSFGLAVILLTVFVRGLLFYFFKNAFIAQKKMAALGPQIKKIQEQHKNSKEEQTRALLDFYKTNKINPFSNFLPILIQIPILISLYKVFFNGIKSIDQNTLYFFVSAPVHFNTYFLNIFDLAQPHWFLALLAGAAQFLQSKYMAKQQMTPAGGGEFASAFQSQMTFFSIYFLPLMTFLIGMTFPAGLALYWATSALLSVLQQLIIEKYYTQHIKIF